MEWNKHHFNNENKIQQMKADSIIFEVGVRISKMEKIRGNNIHMQHLAQNWCSDLVADREEIKYFTRPKPHLDFWVLYCDGSLKPNHDGYEGLLRNEFGAPTLGYDGKSIIQHVLWLELLALCRGLLLARRRNIQSIQIYMDSKLDVDIIDDRICCSWQVLSLKKKIQKILIEFNDSKMLHVWREANQPMDFLAN